MKINIDGKVVWEGECRDGCYIHLVDNDLVTSQDLLRTEPLNDAVIADFYEGLGLIGVEILPHPRDFLSAVAEARENGLTDETLTPGEGFRRGGYLGDAIE